MLLVSLGHFPSLHNNGLYSSLLVLCSCSALSHGYHHFPKDDLPGCPEPVQLRGGGELGGHQSASGQVQGCGQPQWCELDTAPFGGDGDLEDKFCLAQRTWHYKELHVWIHMIFYFFEVFVLFLYCVFLFMRVNNCHTKTEYSERV